LEERRLLSLYLNGIDSNNLGKGMWAWNVGTSMANDGFGSNYSAWFSYLKNTQHLDYVITKAGDGDSQFSPSNSPFGAYTPQYTKSLVNAAHAVGLKIVPYFYIYGDQAQVKSPDTAANHHSTNEAAVFNTVFGANGAGGDFAVFDIESEYGDTDSAGLQNYFNLIGKSASGNGSGSRDRLFMAYSSFDIIRLHSTQLPWKTIADYCDAAMPQMYWKAHGYSISYDLATTDADYRNTTYLGVNGIKPVIPIGQTYDSGSGLPTPSETNQWYNAIKNDTNAVGGAGAPSGWRYKSFNYFDEHTTTSALRAEIAAETIGDRPGTPILSGPGNGSTVTSGENIVLDWSDVTTTFGSQSTGAALYYYVFLDNPATGVAIIDYTAPNLPPSRWTVPGTLSPGVHQWHIAAGNDFGLTSSQTWSFTVPTPFAWMSGSTLHVNFDGTSTPIQLATDGSNVTATRGQTALSFTGVSSILATGTPSDDHLQIASALGAPLTFDNSSGDDTFTLTGGNYAFGNDIGGSMSNVAVVVNSGARATFNASQHLRGLSVDGSMALGAGGDKVLIAATLSIGAGGKLDLADNDLIVRAGTAGTWNGSSYDGITGLVAGGSIFSSLAQSRRTVLGIATAGQLDGLTGAQTAIWNGQTVSASDVLVKYTYAGDANLDGKVNIDDYGRIDANVGQSGSVFGWYSGDFNFDGKINIDDYGLIDSIIGAQGPVL
jgi:hypothetical protein